MPTTVNGIGTHYYGRSVRSSRPGVCRQCGATTTLESYTTRLWFVVIFIPIIPLKRVRVLDYCPACTRHWMADPEKYEEARQTAVSEAMQRHKDNPTVESALDAHAQCLAYHLYEDGDLFRVGALQQFPSHPALLEGLASHLEQVGQWQKATPYYEELLKLTPEVPTVRYSLAWRRISEGRLDEAYELTDYLRVPGAGKSFNLDPLTQLAAACQKNGEHERALEQLEIVLRESPALGKQHGFRALVKKSERALQRTTSLLPEQKFSISGLLDKSGTQPSWMRGAVIWSTIAIIILGGMASINEYIRRHRNLTVLSQFAQPVFVSIDGGPPHPVQLRQSIPVSEGHHQITISGPISRQLEVDMRAPYFSRWFSKPLWILDVEGLSLAYVHTIYYAANPPPSESRALTETLNFVPHVDYPFEEPPAQIKVEGHNSQVTKIQVGYTRANPTTIAMSPRLKGDARLAFLEGYLLTNRNDTMLLHAYLRAEKESTQQVTEFLKSHLWQSPISIAWHRCYQDLETVRNNPLELQQEYDRRLDQTEDHASLLYLRGRQCAHHAEQTEFFQRSYQEDPSLGWPAMGLAQLAISRGDWQAAAPYCAEAAQRLRNDQAFRSTWHAVQLGVGNIQELEQLYRQDSQSTEMADSLTALVRLTDLLAASGRPVEAKAEFRNWWTTMFPQSAGQPTPYDLMVDYLCGDTQAFQNIPAADLTTQNPEYRFHFLLALGRPDEAIALQGLDDELADPEGPLSVALAYSLSNQAAPAAEWQTRAAELFRKDGPKGKLAAELLERDTPPTRDELNDVIYLHPNRILLLAVLAQRFPERQDLKQLAATLNVSHMPPHLLIERAVNAP